ncbi:MAG TPA: carbonic anhydrase [Terriglobia bacterium]|nr:carbonic anhydrase [Terriglobia bacterium]
MGASTKTLVSRRNVLRIGAFTGLGSALLPAFRAGKARASDCTAPDACYGARPATPAAALQALVTGNQEWAAFSQSHPHEDATRRECVFNHGQSPFAAIISCSDSRVPPELVFDQGIGDLFVARVAGNGATATLAESLYYGTSHLCAGLIFVLGHSQCGAVIAAVESFPTGHKLEFVRLIYPAVKAARKIVGPPFPEQQVVQEAVRQNVLNVVRDLRNSPDFKPSVDNGTLLIAGGVYDLATYLVDVVIQ